MTKLQQRKLRELFKKIVEDDTMTREKVIELINLKPDAYGHMPTFSQLNANTIKTSCGIYEVSRMSYLSPYRGLEYMIAQIAMAMKNIKKADWFIFSMTCSRTSTDRDNDLIMDLMLTLFGPPTDTRNNLYDTSDMYIWLVRGNTGPAKKATINKERNDKYYEERCKSFGDYKKFTY